MKKFRIEAADADQKIPPARQASAANTALMTSGITGCHWLSWNLPINRLTSTSE